MRISLKEMERHVEQAKQFSSLTFAQRFYFRQGETSKVVQFLVGAEDVPAYRCHTVQRTSKNGKRYWMDANCMEDKPGGCPLCNYYYNNQGGIVDRPVDKVVIPLINFSATDEAGNPSIEVQYWTRSGSFWRNTVIPFASRFDLNKPIEISKNGSGKESTYILYPYDKTEVNGIRIPSKSKEEFIKEYDVDFERDIPTIVRDLTDSEISQICGVRSLPVSNQELRDEDIPFEVPPTATVRRTKHGF